MLPTFPPESAPSSSRQSSIALTALIPTRRFRAFHGFARSCFVSDGVVARCTAGTTIALLLCFCCFCSVSLGSMNRAHAAKENVPWRTLERLRKARATPPSPSHKPKTTRQRPKKKSTSVRPARRAPSEGAPSEGASSEQAPATPEHQLTPQDARGSDTTALETGRTPAPTTPVAARGPSPGHPVSMIAQRTDKKAKGGKEAGVLSRLRLPAKENQGGEAHIAVDENTVTDLTTAINQGIGLGCLGRWRPARCMDG